MIRMVLSMHGGFLRINMHAIGTMGTVGFMYSNAWLWKAEGISIIGLRSKGVAFNEHTIDDKLNETAG